MSETTETSDISIKQLGTITQLSANVYDTYFLASIVQGDNWSTKNVSYVNLSNDLYAVISVKVPQTETIDALADNVSYLGSLSSSFGDAADFANKYQSISNFLSGFDIGAQRLSTYINNEITALNGTIVAVDNKVTALENGTVTQLSNLITKDDICVDISTLNISVDSIAKGIAGLDVGTIVTLAETVQNISDDLYYNPRSDGGNYTPGVKYAIERNIVDLIDFIDNDVLTSYMVKEQNLSNYIETVSRDIVSQVVANIIAANYTLVDNTIAEKLNADNNLKTANSLKEYIKSVVNETYIKSFINDAYIKSIVDAEYIRSIVDQT